MTLIQLYSKFCNFIDEQIFSEDNVGMSVSFVVDKALITEFCKKNYVTENTLMDAVRVHLYSYSKDIKHIKGIQEDERNGKVVLIVTSMMGNHGMISYLLNY